MSTAMEKMVANMLGFTPEQMHETLNGFRDTIITLKGTLERIEAKIDDSNSMVRDLHILATETEGTPKNDDRNDSDNNRP